MRSGRLVLLVALLLVVVMAVPSFAQFDNKGRNLGIGGYTGLGLMFSGGGNAYYNIAPHMRIKMIEGFYLDPGIDFGVGSIGSSSGYYGGISESFWDLSFGPYATYVFRINNSPVHPYAGFGPIAFHIMHFGDVTDTYGNVYGTGATKFYVGINWTAGAEFVLNRQVSLNFDWKYHLIFADGTPGEMLFQAGFFYYLP
jgi:hypothetical protein